MGREVRRVPPNWMHPKITDNGKVRDQPMHDETYEEACAEWKREFAEWEAGTHEYYRSGKEYWEFAGVPDERWFYRPWKAEEATWWQLWQTVSEGTPVSPPFATKEELIAYLAEYGDFWDQTRSAGGWGLERAKAFFEAGWAPSMAVKDGRILDSKDIPLSLKSSESQQHRPEPCSA